VRHALCPSPDDPNVLSAPWPIRRAAGRVRRARPQKYSAPFLSADFRAFNPIGISPAITEQTMTDKPPFYITTAISYPNAAPHLGHAYEAISTDAIARFKRLDGYDVLFLTGVDEHGLKMKQTAARQGLTPRELGERNTQLFRDMVKTFNISNDDFIRTTEERHHRAVAEIWRRMEKAGDIYLAKYAGWYSVRDEAFYSEDETTLGEDGTRRSPTGAPVEWTKEETYFFRLSRYEAPLLRHYEENPDFILPPERRNEIVSFVRGGLQDLSVSRTTIDWGVPVPGAPGHVVYVWVDALTNYLTGAGFPDENCDRFKRRWPADVHVIGKDIVRFHAVYWPAFLMSAGIAPPKRIYAHGFLHNRGEKMSKSVGNVVDPLWMAQHYGVDQVRYFVLREPPYGQDGSYSREAIVNRANADLANDFGNLAQRSLSMIAKNCGGRIPQPGALTARDDELLSAADQLYGFAREAMERQALNRVLEAVWAVVGEANRYFASEEPWSLKKTDPERMATVLYVTAETVRQAAILAQPFTPASAAKMLDQLGVPAEARAFASLGAAGRLRPGTALGELSPVFPRYVEEDKGKAAP
jgi:methionyl-tRNA synthetase